MYVKYINLNGNSKIKATSNFTAKSPKAHINHLGTSNDPDKIIILSVAKLSSKPMKEKVNEKAIVKNSSVSIIDPNVEDAKGAFHHWYLLNFVKICISINWDIKKALPDAIAILGVAK